MVRAYFGGNHQPETDPTRVEAWLADRNLALVHGVQWGGGRGCYNPCLGPLPVGNPSARGRVRARETRRTDEDVYGEYDEVAATEVVAATEKEAAIPSQACSWIRWEHPVGPPAAAISGQAGPRLCKERRQNTLRSDAVSRARSRPKPGAPTGRGPWLRREEKSFKRQVCLPPLSEIRALREPQAK
jgi:hypothetical protein